jgi:hypothetical protein
LGLTGNVERFERGIVDPIDVDKEAPITAAVSAINDEGF